MHLDFMKPDVWNGLVLGAVLIGLSLAVLRIMSDFTSYRHKHSRPKDDPRQRHDHDSSDDDQR